MKPFKPAILPITDFDYKRLIGLVGEANASLAEYKGLLQGLVNSEILLSPLTSQESLISSKIEGTQATLEEVLEHEAGKDFDEPKKNDIREILNYRKAIFLCQQHVKSNPISLNLILQ